MKTLFSPEELEKIIDEWIEYIEHKTVSIQVPKTNPITGKALTIDRPITPTKETFCKYAKISRYTFRDWVSNKSHPLHACAKRVEEYTNSTMLEFGILGIYSSEMVKYYLTNNDEDYDDVKVKELRIVQSDRPSWLSSNKAIQVSGQKQLPSESIEFEDVPVKQKDSGHAE